MNIPVSSAISTPTPFANVYRKAAAVLALALIALPGFASEPFVGSAKEPHGRVIALVDRTAQDLRAVEIDEVDGHRVGGPRRDVAWLAPGTYTLTLTGAVVDERFTTALSRPSQPLAEGANTLELDIEAGKTYYIALDTSASNRKDWRHVVWKVDSTHTSSQY